MLNILKKFKIWTRSDISQDSYLGVTMRERISKQLEKKRLDESELQKQMMNSSKKSKILSQKSSKISRLTKQGMKFGNPVVGYAGFDRMVASGNVHAQDYQKARKKGEGIAEKNTQSHLIRKKKTGSSISRSSRSYKSSKKSKKKKKYSK